MQRCLCLCTTAAPLSNHVLPLCAKVALKKNACAYGVSLIALHCLAIHTYGEHPKHAFCIHFKLQIAELSTHFFHFSPLIPQCRGTLLKPCLTCENKTKILPSKCLPEAPALQSKVWGDLFGPPSELCGLISPACISGPLQ